jgi:hypothetical protein
MITVDPAYAHDPRAQAGRANTGKVELSLVPTVLTEEVAKVLMFGAQKYDKHNWRKGFAWTSVMNSMMRHVNAWLDGEDLDPESGLPHLAHIGCNVAFLLEFRKYGMGIDDRYKRSPQKLGECNLADTQNPFLVVAKEFSNNQGVN